jgi:hypothetical protein
MHFQSTLQGMSLVLGKKSSHANVTFSRILCLWNILWALASLPLSVRNSFCRCSSSTHTRFLYFVPSLWVPWVLCVSAMSVVRECREYCAWGPVREGGARGRSRSALWECVREVRCTMRQCWVWVRHDCDFSSTVVRCFVPAGSEVLLLSAAGFVLNYQLTLWTCKSPLLFLPSLLGAIAYVGLDLGFRAAFGRGLSLVHANLSPKRRSKRGIDVIDVRSAVCYAEHAGFVWDFRRRVGGCGYSVEWIISVQELFLFIRCTPLTPISFRCCFLHRRFKNMLWTNSSQGLKFVMSWYEVLDNVCREYIQSFPMFERGLFNLRMLGWSLSLN